MSYRTELVELLPWVTRLARSRPCDGYRWSRMPQRAVRDAELRQEFRCRSLASWRYVTSRGRWSGKSGSYCWNHLVDQLEHASDRRRNRGWWLAHLDEVNAIRTYHGYVALPLSLTQRRDVITYQ